MWSAAVRFSELSRRGRWTVETHADAEGEAAPSALPLVAIRELVTVRRETVEPSARPDERFRYIGLEHVESLTGDLRDAPVVEGRTIRSRSKLFRAGDILFGRLRPYLNKVHLADEDGICTAELYVLVPDLARVTPRLLRALLSSDRVLARAGACQSGSALPRLPLDELLGIEVPLPPRDEQPAWERFLAARDAERRRLRREASEQPLRTREALLRALATGRPPGEGGEG